MTYEWDIFRRIDETPAPDGYDAVRARPLNVSRYLQELAEHGVRLHAPSHAYEMLLPQRRFEAFQDVRGATQRARTDHIHPRAAQGLSGMLGACLRKGQPVADDWIFHPRVELLDLFGAGHGGILVGLGLGDALLDWSRCVPTR